MPRNCGCSGGCSCVIQEGSGASVTGSGRAGDPYVVALAGGGGGGSGFDTGDLKWTALPTAPAGWLVCDGAAVSRAVFSDLFDALGTTYGPGDGTTTFNLPDYTGKFMLGADSTHGLGSTGGAEERTLTAAQVPSHTHPIDHDHPSAASSSDAHNHDLTIVSAASTEVGGGAIRVTDVQGATGATGTTTHKGTSADTHSHTVNLPAYAGASGAAGGGQPVSMMPPYGTALPLIKT